MTDLVWSPYGLEKPEPEYKFHPSRRWRLDYAWINRKVAVEVEGGVWSHGRHTRGSGFLKDMEKYNEAAKVGFRVFRFTPQQVQSGEAQQFMKGVFE